MPYLGNLPAERYSSADYQDLTGGTGTSFTLDHPVGNAQEVLVVVNNVVQEPGVAYTVSGTGLTMTGSIASTDDFYVVFRGKAVLTATFPSDRALTATDGTFTGDLTVDTSVLKVDSSNDAVGINTTPQSFSDLQIKTATNRHLAIFDNTNGPTICALNDAGSSVQTRIAGQNIVFSGAGGSGTEHLRIQSGGGISFNGDTAAANALDDYEEGTWTPAVSTASATASATGIYTKIGNIVSIQCVIQYTQSGTTFGSISGLPFTVATVNYTPLAFREWYSTGVALFGNLVIGAQSTSGFYNSANSSTAVSGQQYGFALQAVYRT